MAPVLRHRKRGPANAAPLTPPGVYQAPDFLDSVACGHVRAAMDRGTIEPAEVLYRRIRRDRDVRRAMSIDVDPEARALVEERLDSRRDVIGRFFGVQLTGREGAGFLRYGPGGFYRPHRDRGTSPSWPKAARRCIALVVFLNGSTNGAASGGFSGGALRLLEPAPVDIAPRQGAIVAFPAATLHEVAPVVEGIRDSIVDWFY